jgi:hypothetical protein
MIILVANEGKFYDQYKLYSLILDKFRATSDFVPHEFKCKFFIILRSLMIKDNNIKVIKENNIYQVSYNPPKNIKPSYTNYNPAWIDSSQLNNFIINNQNKLIEDNKEYINYKDIESGNTIYHDVFSQSSCENVKKLLEINNLNYNIKNNLNKTPIECIKNIEVASIIINELYNKINLLENKVNIINEVLNKTNHIINNYDQIINKYDQILESNNEIKNKYDIIIHKCTYLYDLNDEIVDKYNKIINNNHLLFSNITLLTFIKYKINDFIVNNVMSIICVFFAIILYFVIKLVM